MAQAIRVVAAEGRRDPSKLALVPFGGAGALHAAGIMEALEIERAYIPPHPGLFSAEGIRRAPVVYHHTVRINAPLKEFEPPDSEDEFLDRYVRPALHELGLEGKEARCRMVVDLRYRGQSHHLSLPFKYGETVKTLELSFHRRHNREFGFRHIGHPVDACCLRLVISLEKGLPGSFHKEKQGHGPEKFEGGEPLKIRHEGQWLEGRTYPREMLGAHAVDHGPLVITEYSSCIFVPPLWRVENRADGWLELERAWPNEVEA
jgi:N-methylhydantoinase A